MEATTPHERGAGGEAFALLYERERAALNATAAATARLTTYHDPAARRLNTGAFVWMALPFPVLVIMVVVSRIFPQAERVIGVVGGVILGGGFLLLLAGVVAQWVRVLSPAPTAPIVPPPFEAPCEACGGPVQLPAAGAPRCSQCGVPASAAVLGGAWKRAVERVAAAEAARGAAERQGYLALLALPQMRIPYPDPFGRLARRERRNAVNAAIEATVAATGGRLIRDDFAYAPRWLDRHWPASVGFDCGSIVSKGWTVELTHRGAPALLTVLDHAPTRGSPARGSIHLYLAIPVAMRGALLHRPCPGPPGFEVTAYEQGVHCVSPDDDPRALTPEAVGRLFEAAAEAAARR